MVDLPIRARLDRVSHRRSESLVEEHLAAQQSVTAGENATLLIYCDGRPLVGEAGLPVELALVELPREFAPQAVFLGMLDGRARYVIELRREQLETAFSSLREAATMPFRQLVPALAQEQGELLSFAQGILNWRRDHRFCPSCGAPLLAEASGHVLACSVADCGRKMFPRIDPVVIMLAICDDRVLLVRHRRERSSGFFSSIAGFVEHGETLEQAVARETAEEIGLTVDEIGYFGSQAWPLPGSMMVGFWARVRDDKVVMDSEELLETRWFRRDELLAPTQPLAAKFSIAGTMIGAWARGAELTFRPFVERK